MVLKDNFNYRVILSITVSIIGPTTVMSSVVIVTQMAKQE